jgi:hypothetical protein
MATEIKFSDPIHGLPTILMFPASNYTFKVSEKEFTLKIPRRGCYHDLCPEHFSIERDGEFCIYDDESKILYIPAITKVLFAINQYPELEYNQFFAPIALVIDDDEVSIIGNIVEFSTQLSNFGV